MLKEILSQFKQIGVTNSMKGSDGKNILLQQSTCDHVERIFNGGFVELSNKNNSETLYSPSKVILKNNPDNISITSVNEYEDRITLTYDDYNVQLMGYGK